VGVLHTQKVGIEYKEPLKGEGYRLRPRTVRSFQRNGTPVSPVLGPRYILVKELHERLDYGQRMFRNPRDSVLHCSIAGELADTLDCRDGKFAEPLARHGGLNLGALA
jgi:hypothetical protein